MRDLRSARHVLILSRAKTHALHLCLYHHLWLMHQPLLLVVLLLLPG
jgi:hypothetical protein